MQISAATCLVQQASIKEEAWFCADFPPKIENTSPRILQRNSFPRKQERTFPRSLKINAPTVGLIAWKKIEKLKHYLVICKSPYSFFENSKTKSRLYLKISPFSP